MQRDFRFQSWFFGRGFLTYAFFALFAAAIVGQEPVTKADVEPLVLGKQIDHEMIGGQKHEYTVSVVQDQLAKILVEEKGIDVLVRVLDPEGKMVSQEEGSKASARRMTLQFIASITASYQIEVTSKVSSAIKGSYSIVLQDLHAASDNDRSLQESSDLLGQVTGLIASGNYKEAVPLAERALEIREKILDPDDPAVGVVLGRLGVALFYLGDDVKAEGHFKRAIGIYEKNTGRTILL